MSPPYRAMNEVTAPRQMRNEEAGFLDHEAARLAWRKIAGAGATIVWLGGFASEMTGTKASALADWAARKGRNFLRFDYFGHGESDGDFGGGTITRWRGDALAVIAALTEGPLVLVGSSMGGWIASLVALARPARVASLALIAPAVDFTEALMRPRLPPEALTALERDGVWDGQEGAGPISRALLEDGARWSLLPGPVPIEVPARILQGGADGSVPWRHALEFAQALKSEDVVFTLAKDGDHRLSRPADLARMIAMVEELTTD